MLDSVESCDTFRTYNTSGSCPINQITFQLLFAIFHVIQMNQFIFATNTVFQLAFIIIILIQFKFFDDFYVFQFRISSKGT
eukprot:04338.XXX_155534_155776_1 [CDS] Oithona nana genome sequencing.